MMLWGLRAVDDIRTEAGGRRQPDRLEADKMKWTCLWWRASNVSEGQCQRSCQKQEAGDGAYSWTTCCLWGYLGLVTQLIKRQARRSSQGGTVGEKRFFLGGSLRSLPQSELLYARAMGYPPCANKLPCMKVLIKLICVEQLSVHQELFVGKGKKKESTESLV